MHLSLPIRRSISRPILTPCTLPVSAILSVLMVSMYLVRYLRPLPLKATRFLDTVSHLLVWVLTEVFPSEVSSIYLATTLPCLRENSRK